MNLILDIESFLEFRDELSRIEVSFLIMRKEKLNRRRKLKKNTYDKLISLFKKYIDWLVEEHDPGGKYQVLRIRKSYDVNGWENLYL